MGACVRERYYYYYYLFLQIPGAGDLFSYYVDFESRRFEPWEKIIPSFTYDPEVIRTML